MHKKFYSSHWFLNNQIFSLFPIVKTNANYAEICRVGNLEAEFQQVLLFCSIFVKFLQYRCEMLKSQIQERKEKNIF